MMLNEILSLTPDKLSKFSNAELQILQQNLFSIANNRIEALENTGLSKMSMSYHNLGNKNKFMFYSTKKAQLHEIKRAIAFINGKTSTVTGTQDYIKKIRQRLQYNLSDDRLSQMWRVYNVIRKSPKNPLSYLDSEQVISIVESYVAKQKRNINTNRLDYTESYWYKTISRLIDEEYEREQTTINEYDQLRPKDWY